MSSCSLSTDTSVMSNFSYFYCMGEGDLVTLEEFIFTFLIAYFIYALVAVFRVRAVEDCKFRFYSLFICGDKGPLRLIWSNIVDESLTYSFGFLGITVDVDLWCLTPDSVAESFALNLI